jgi:Asp-tRNA(Asn)/Glu-tRNA(Gln) amidotransferase B subunit
MFYCGFYSVDVAVAFLNHFLTVGRHGLNVCRIKTTIKCDINVSITPPLSTRVVRVTESSPLDLLGFGSSNYLHPSDYIESSRKCCHAAEKKNFTGWKTTIYTRKERVHYNTLASLESPTRLLTRTSTFCFPAVRFEGPNTSGVSISSIILGNPRNN